MGRNPERERERVLQKVRAYLARATTDRSLELTYDAIAAGAGVSRSHFAKTQEPDILELVSEIQALRAARTGASADAPPMASPSGATRPGSATDGVADLSDPALAADIRHTVQELARHTQVWLGHHRALASIDDAPLALYDLDRMLGSLYRDRERLAALISERDRRAQGHPAEPQLVIDLTGAGHPGT